MVREIRKGYVIESDSNRISIPLINESGEWEIIKYKKHSAKCPICGKVNVIYESKFGPYWDTCEHFVGITDEEPPKILFKNYD